jgi:hypothetical protein
MIRQAAILLLLMPLMFIGCHTYLWQNVGNEIQGTWTLMPVEPGNTVQFTFEKGKLRVARNGFPITFEDENGNVVDEIGYSVENKLNNQYVYIDKYLMPGFGYQSHMFNKTFRWLVITVKDDELFLESLGEEGLKGEFQLHFFRF